MESRVMRYSLGHQLAIAVAAIGILVHDSPAGETCQQWTVSPFIDQPQGINDLVETMTIWTAPGGASLLVVGGYFTSAGGVAVNHIAAWDGASWRALGAGLDGPVYCLSVFNGELIAGGAFMTSAGTPMARIARWNGTQWQPLGSGLLDSTPSSVSEPRCMSLTVFNGELIVGGRFAIAGGVTANNIARWNGSSWSALASPGVQGVLWTSSPAVSTVSGLTVLNNNLYVGGWFTVAGNVGASHIARWNGSTWSPLGSGLNGIVYELSQFNGEVIVGGEFSTAGGSPANHVARWNATTNSWGAFGGGINQSAYAFQNFQGGLLAGGVPLAGGSALMFWNGSTWSTFNSAVSGTTPPWETGVSALAVYGSQLHVGGSFTHAGTATGPNVNNFVKFDGTLWQPVEAYPGDLVAMTTMGSRVVVGGLFIQSCGTGGPAYNIAAWNGSSLSRFGSGTNNPVFALKSFTVPGPFGGDILIAGGAFTAVNGFAANRIAQWNANNILEPWSAMGSGFNSSVLAIERHSNVIYAGGSFTDSGGTAVSRIARWTGTVWQALGSGCNGTVYAMQSYNGQLYVGGDFTSAGGVSTGGLARWNATTNTWSNVGGFFLGTVRCLTVHNGELVIGGVYPGINNSPNIAKYNGSSYSTPGTGGTNGQVGALTSANGYLYIGGTFTTAGGLAANRVARWSSTTGWSAVQSGVSGSVVGMTYLNGELHVGGPFASAGSPPVASPGWARYLTTGAAWIVQNPASQTVECNDPVAFTVAVAVGYNPVTALWHRNGVQLTDGLTPWGSTISGALAKTLSITNARPEDAGAYHCTVFNSCGSANSTTATLTVQACCDGDTNDSGTVNIDDLVAVVISWGACTNCPADVAPPGGNGVVDIDDLVAVIVSWGMCP